MSSQSPESEPLFYVISYRDGNFKSVPVTSKKSNSLSIFSKVRDKIKSIRR